MILVLIHGFWSPQVNSQKYGVSLARFTHARNAAVHASTKVDDDLRYLSLHDNKFLRYFKVSAAVVERESIL